MRKIIMLLILSVFFLNTVRSQTKEDYNQIATTVTEFYNANNSEEIFNLFSNELKTSLTMEELKTTISKSLENKGKITEFDLLTEDAEFGYNYLIELDSSSMLLIIKLSPSKKLSLFQIQEY